MSCPKRPIPHGTVSGYRDRRCRCQDCRDAWAAYKRADREYRKAMGICWDCSQPAGPTLRCALHQVSTRKKAA